MSDLNRYLQLLNRVKFDLKLLNDAAVKLGLEQKRMMRIRRARREVADELAETEVEKESDER